MGRHSRPGFLKFPTCSFFLGAHRDDRLSPTLKAPHLAIEILELSIPVRMMTAFTGLAIGLQAVAQPIQESGYRPVAGGMALALQLLGQLANAFARPTKTALWRKAKEQTTKGFRRLTPALLLDGSLWEGQSERESTPDLLQVSTRRLDYDPAPPAITTRAKSITLIPEAR